MLRGEMRNLWQRIHPQRPAKRGFSAFGLRGQALTEFALLGPVLIVLTLGVADAGRAFYYQEATVNASRQAVRLAAHDHSYGDFACTNFRSGNQAVVSRQLPDPGVDKISSLVNLGALETSTNGSSTSSALNTTPATTITLTWNCQGNSAITNAAAGNTTDPTVSGSDAVRAQVDYSFTLITPFIGRLMYPAPPATQAVHIRSDVRGRAEY